MTIQSIAAVFEDGYFRPVRPIDPPLVDGQQVRLVVETDLSADEILELAMSVYDGLSVEEIDEIEQVALQRGDSISAEL